ncbi:hypothetical protein C2G38_2036455 [Gigaspora rosea]|uniref:Uncharacterized protein n=1 Tax=Gigaspora rosea TaxID=44941 RepID=A0A397V8X4_9GLOM|nr:hypothetical protein C2G38_2036455 [Gigaspora rosea]
MALRFMKGHKALPGSSTRKVACFVGQNGCWLLTPQGLHANLPCSTHALFSVTSLKWSNDIKKFTGLVYASDPTVTAQQVFSQYTQNLADVTIIESIESGVVQRIHSFNNMIIKTEYLKIIGDTLFEIIQKDAIKRKIKTGKTQNIFQSATEDDVENRKNARYINNYDLSEEINNFFQRPAEKKQFDLFCKNWKMKWTMRSVRTKIVLSEDEPDTDKENDVDDRGEEVDTPPKVNKDIKPLFDEEEWKELTKDPIGIPPISHEIAKENEVQKKSLKELRAVVMEPYLKEKEEYDVNKHYEQEWTQMALRTLCNLYENVDAPLISSQYEDWFTITLFGTCIDFCFRDIQLSTDIKRLWHADYHKGQPANPELRTVLSHI